MAQERIGGRYSLGEQLGRGGMATVYLAHDEQFGRDVAIKMLHNMPGDELEEFMVRKFQQEAKIIASLEHYAIVPVYDYGRHDGWPFLVMRLMNGGTLKDSIRQGPLPLAEIEIVLERICAALERAHSKNVVHRDIKPTNIFMDEEGLVYLGDFGIARLTAGDQTTSYLGSPRYMAPEQAQGDPLSPATDIYQMGIVLFEMLTGRKPYSGETPEQTILMHLQHPIPMPSDLDPNLPIGLDPVIGKALAKDPADRYQTAGQLARAFRNALTSPPAASQEEEDSAEHFVDSEFDLEVPTPETRAYQPYKTPFFLDEEHTRNLQPTSQTFLQSNRWLLWLAAVSLMVLLGCGATYFAARAAGFFADPTEANEGLILPQPILEQDGEAESGENGAVDVPIPVATVTELSTRQPEVIEVDAAEIARLGGGNGELIFASEQDETFSIFGSSGDGVIPISQNRFSAFGAVYSPSGQFVAWHEQHPSQKTWEIYVADADGGNIRNLTNNVADDSFPRWSPDGGRIVFHSNRNGEQFDLFVIDVLTGDSTQLTDTEQSEFGPAFSPDGDSIVFHRRFSRSVTELFVMGVDGAADEEQITNLNRDSQFASWSPTGEKIVFHAFVSGTWQLFVHEPATRNTNQITFDEQNSFYAKWSPNGEWIAFHREFENENRDLFLVSATGDRQIRLTDTAEQERMPDWAPSQP